jgi:hypothetical protein
LVFKKKANLLFAEIVQKSPKIVIITLTPDFETGGLNHRKTPFCYTFNYLFSSIFPLLHFHHVCHAQGDQIVRILTFCNCFFFGGGSFFLKIKDAAQILGLLFSHGKE